MTHFSADMVQRSHEEIEDVCKELRASLETHRRTYEELTYEEGVLAAVRWIFFKTAENPCDGKNKNLSATVARTQLEIENINRAQAREGSDA